MYACLSFFFFFSSRRRHTRCSRDWSSDVCSSDLWKRYDDTLAVRELSLHIEDGEFMVLVGPSGCGKRSEEHTSELRHGYTSYAVFCLKKKNHRHAVPRVCPPADSWQRAGFYDTTS